MLDDQLTGIGLHHHRQPRRAERRVDVDLGRSGCGDLDRLRSEARFVRMTSAGLRESHPHDVSITEAAPNYRLR